MSEVRGREKFIINNKIKGIDRIVPIGQALELDFIWDGYDINKLKSFDVEYVFMQLRTKLLILIL